MTSKRAERRAEELLITFGLLKSPVDVRQVAKKLGALVREEPFTGSERLSGILYRDDNIKVIGVNTAELPQRQRFTIAHEIGHLVLHQGDAVHVDTYHTFQVNFRDPDYRPGTDRRETEANAFAAALLMPEALVKEEFDQTVRRGIDIVDGKWIEDIAIHFDVSIQALTIRLNQLGLLDSMAF